MSEMKKQLGSDDLGTDAVAEIEKHKYFLSEKAGHDVGWEFAEQDYRERYGLPESRSLRRDAADSVPSRGLAARIKRFLSRNKAASV